MKLMIYYLKDPNNNVFIDIDVEVLKIQDNENPFEEDRIDIIVHYYCWIKQLYILKQVNTLEIVTQYYLKKLNI